MRFASSSLHNYRGHYELNPFPGNSQIIVSNHVWIDPRDRGQGFGKVQHKERLEKARDLGYDYILCTVNSKNELERKILFANGWEPLAGFTNTETGNFIYIHGKSLQGK